MNDADRTKGDNFVKSFWLGRQDLWKAFWVLGVFVFLLKIPGIYALKLDLPVLWWYGYILVIVSVQVWWIVSVWRCAGNSQRLIWKVLARIFAVYSGLDLVFRLFIMIV